MDAIGAFGKSVVAAIHRVREFLSRAVAQFAPDLATASVDENQSIIRTEHGVHRFNPKLITTGYATFSWLEADTRGEQYHARRAELAAQALALLRES